MAIRVLLSRVNHRCCTSTSTITLFSLSHLSSSFISSSSYPPQSPHSPPSHPHSLIPFPSHKSPTPQFHAAFARDLCTASETADYAQELEEINSKFAEAREEIELALESKETVYFDEDAEIARSVTREVLCRFEALLARLSDAEKGRVQRSMGLKMEQLKAELAQLDAGGMKIDEFGIFAKDRAGPLHNIESIYGH